ncbi:MAG TPA: HAD-IA family hydrolase [Acidimicrobiales bacterium]|nr:HAD-IA family hydrolase [Acidimicrobiales bacterium]
MEYTRDVSLRDRASLTALSKERQNVGVKTRGVLFDWRGTLVGDPDDGWWVRSALECLERSAGDAEVDQIVDRLRIAGELPSVVVARQTADCSAEQHHAATMLQFAEAGLDDALARALYQLDFEPVAHPLYEDVPETLQRLKALGVAVAIVSDIHFDLRPEFALLGLESLIDSFVLSFERGVQKPDPRIFEIALDSLGVEPREALMVGDRPARDGAAVLVGIPTLLLPIEHGPRRGLSGVLALMGIPPASPG